MTKGENDVNILGVALARLFQIPCAVTVSKTAEGITIQGGLQKDQSLSLRELMSRLENQMDIWEGIADVAIDRLWISCQASSGIFSFEGKVSSQLSNRMELSGELVLLYSKDNTQQKIKGKVDGTVTFDEYGLTLEYETSEKTSQIGIHFTAKEKPMGVAEFIKELTGLIVDVPAGLDLALYNLDFSWDLKSGQFLAEAKSEQYGDFFLQSETDKENKREYLFVMRYPVEISLSDLPVIGGISLKLAESGIKKIILISSSEKRTNVSLADILTECDVEKGINLQLIFSLMDHEEVLQIPLYAPKKNARQDENKGIKKDFHIDKCIGPLQLNRIIAAYEEGYLKIGLCGSVWIGSLNFGLENLYIGYNLNTNNVMYGLDGLSLDVKMSSFQMGGAFYRQLKDTYAGGFLIGAGGMQVQAYGLYQNSITPSFFLLGGMKGFYAGVPSFTVTGASLGAGYNRALNIPELSHVGDFPLLEMTEGTVRQQEIMEHLTEYFPESAGNYWGAAGIVFQSFKQIDGYAAVSVQFGRTMEVSLLGKAVLDIPHGSREVIAHAELQLRAAFLPESSLLSVEAELTENTYVLSKECRLAGGFALYVWYGGNRKGDFVVCLGGYHPSYQKPAYYPCVKPLSFSWNIGAGLYAGGSMYFALTPSSVMAGGYLEITYTSSCVDAWFTAKADIMIQWKPQQYQLFIGISIGVKVHLAFIRFKLELGCELRIWGPEFSGYVKIKLWCISFTISFGNSKNQPRETISTEEFEETFLVEKKNAFTEQRKQDSVISLQVTGGFLHKGKEEEVPKVAADTIEITASTKIPPDTIQLVGSFCPDSSMPCTTFFNDGKKAYVRPCQKKLGNSQLILMVEKEGKKAEISMFWGEIMYQQLPSALWAEKEEKKETVEMPGGIILRTESSYGRQLSFKREILTRNYPAGKALKEEIMHSETMLTEYYLPPLKDGYYRVGAVIKTDLWNDMEAVPVAFEISGPRFILREDEIRSVYPPVMEEGDFGQVLPKIVFQRKTLPWERESITSNTPWLYLLCGSKEELGKLVACKVKDAFTAKKTVYLPKLNLAEEEKEEDCCYGEIPLNLWKAIFPRQEELPYLAYAENHRAQEENADWYSVLCGNRLPENSREGQDQTCWVVSLEGLEELFDDSFWEKDNGWKSVRILVLYHWDFVSRKNEVQFQKLAENLTVKPLWSDEGRWKENLYSFLPIRDPDENKVFYYQGPFCRNEPEKEEMRVVERPVDLYQYRQELQGTDVSYAAAWQIGKLGVLSQKQKASEIMKKRIETEKQIRMGKMKAVFCTNTGQNQSAYGQEYLKEIFTRKRGVWNEIMGINGKTEK